MVLDLLFRVGPAIQAIFQLGYEPKENLFFELTCEQYSQIEQEGYDISKPWFTIIPKNPQLDCTEFQIIAQDEKQTLMDAADHINKLCNKPEAPDEFQSYEDKLRYVASKLPPVFSEQTKYAKKTTKATHLKVVK